MRIRIGIGNRDRDRDRNRDGEGPWTAFTAPRGRGARARVSRRRGGARTRRRWPPRRGARGSTSTAPIGRCQRWSMTRAAGATTPAISGGWTRYTPYPSVAKRRNQREEKKRVTGPSALSSKSTSAKYMAARDGAPREDGEDVVPPGERTEQRRAAEDGHRRERDLARRARQRLAEERAVVALHVGEEHAGHEDVEARVRAHVDPECHLVRRPRRPRREHRVAHREAREPQPHERRRAKRGAPHPRQRRREQRHRQVKVLLDAQGPRPRHDRRRREGRSW